MAFEDYYNNNPLAAVDQNEWLDKEPAVNMQFQTGPVVYTPLLDYEGRSASTGAAESEFTELLEGDVDNDEISKTAMYIAEPLGVDSRSRRMTVQRFGDKVQYSKFESKFQQWKMSGGRDWRPLMQGILGNNVVRKMEVLARNAHLLGDRTFWTYAGGATSIGEIEDDDRFELETTLEWEMRLGNLGTPVIPGDIAAAKLAIMPPGVTYDFRKSVAAASSNEASLWRDVQLYAGTAIRSEIGTHGNVRFVKVPTDRYGQNLGVLYNAGEIHYQGEVSSPIERGDGSPDPEAEKVDGVWYVGQKDKTHFVQLAALDAGDINKNDIVSLHSVRTNDFGVTDGVDFLSGKTISRRVVGVDYANNRVAFDRPIMKPYTSDLGGGVYGYITRARHIGMTLVLGSRGGIKVNVNTPLAFYEPVAIDDFQSVFRFVWDIWQGYNIWEPQVFEVHFSAVSLPKPGGVLTS